MMLEMFSREMSEEEMSYEEYPYKDYNGWNLSKGDLVRMVNADPVYGDVLRVMKFSEDARKAMVMGRNQLFWWVSTGFLLYLTSGTQTPVSITKEWDYDSSR